MPNVTCLGAGSAVFARRLITDILHVDGLDQGVIAPVDIDARRLDLIPAASSRRWRPSLDALASEKPGRER